MSNEEGGFRTEYADQGSNVSLHCVGHKGSSGVLWTHHRRGSDDVPLSLSSSSSRRVLPQPNGDLLIHGLLPEDSKPYTCQDMESNESIHTVFLVVRTAPPAVANLTVIPHSASFHLSLAFWHCTDAALFGSFSSYLKHDSFPYIPDGCLTAS